MSNTKLSDYFEAVTAKELSRVEVDTQTSNQHEFNGVNSLRQILGENPEPETFKCTFMYQDDVEESIVHEGEVTWYDARRNDPNRSAEFRLYFKHSPVMELAREGDLLVFAKLVDGGLLAIVAAAGTSAESKLRYIFNVGASDLQQSFDFDSKDHSNRFCFDKSLDQKDVNFVKMEILEAIGIEILDRADDFLDLMIEKFDGCFPGTKEFSKFARKTCRTVTSTRDPDFALVEWISWEHKLFLSLERFIVEKRLEKNIRSVDEFISYSLSVQNRRKSRAGHALENHLVAIFDDRKLQFARGCRTESHSKPDFMFPSCEAYNNPSFPADGLAMLGAKSTCKDRWRQVLSEARRIEKKHLLTLEGGISVNQTNEMQNNRLQLVVPGPIQESYLEDQRKWLMNLGQFIGIVVQRHAESTK